MFFFFIPQRYIMHLDNVHPYSLPPVSPPHTPTHLFPIFISFLFSTHSIQIVLPIWGIWSNPLRHKQTTSDHNAKKGDLTTLYFKVFWCDPQFQGMNSFWINKSETKVHLGTATCLSKISLFLSHCYKNML